MNKCFNTFAGERFCVVTISVTETVRTAVIAQNMTSYSRKMVMYNNWDQLTWQRQGRTALIELKANSCSVQQTAIVFQIFCANVLCKCSVQIFPYIQQSSCSPQEKHNTLRLGLYRWSTTWKQSIFSQGPKKFWQWGYPCGRCGSLRRLGGRSSWPTSETASLERAFPNPPSPITSPFSQRRIRRDICFKKDLHYR